MSQPQMTDFQPPPLRSAHTPPTPELSHSATKSSSTNTISKSKPPPPPPPSQPPSLHAAGTEGTNPPAVPHPGSERSTTLDSHDNTTSNYSPKERQTVQRTSLVNDAIPALKDALGQLQRDSAEIERSFENVCTALGEQIKQISEISVSHMNQLANVSADARHAVDTTVTRATLFVDKCEQLDRQMSQIDTFEAQLKGCRRRIEALEKTVRKADIS